MEIRLAAREDLTALLALDRHIGREELENLIGLHRVFIAEEEGAFAGWLRYNLFWDNTPFMNMLFLLESYRNRGIGRKLVAYWEESMKNKGYDSVMTSTQWDEYAQHFYYKLGYCAVGGFALAGETYELLLQKQL